MKTLHVNSVDANKNEIYDILEGTDNNEWVVLLQRRANTLLKWFCTGWSSAKDLLINKSREESMKKHRLFILSAIIVCSLFSGVAAASTPRVIATTDGEIDDQCSMVRFLLYANEWDVEGIVTSSSQYHSHGHNWAGDDWVQPYLEAYAQVYPNLLKHDSHYPTPEYLRDRTRLGNVKSEGAMEEVTPGSQLITRVLLDESDNRPVWLLAWGGPNTIARALKTIEEEHPDKMAYVAHKIRFFFIWEQDSTYQSYIRPHWGKYDILTIISDQFLAIAYDWDKILPADKQTYFTADWMKAHILEGHGPLCALYKAHTAGEEGYEAGDFRSEGDSPSFIYDIITGLRNGNLEHPDWGSWGGRYTNVRGNTWLDPVPDPTYRYPAGRWWTGTAWGREYLRSEYPGHQEQMTEYFKPIARWTDALQNDFASRADWCVKSYADANHPPVVAPANPRDLAVRPGATVQLNTRGYDPDGDALTYRWWQYQEASSYKGNIKIRNAGQQNAAFTIPKDARTGQTIHMVCTVQDNGTPPLSRYQRVIVTVQP